MQIFSDDLLMIVMRRGEKYFFFLFFDKSSLGIVAIMRNYAVPIKKKTLFFLHIHIQKTHFIMSK